VLPWTVNEKNKIVELKQKAFFGAISDFPNLLEEEKPANQPKRGLFNLCSQEHRDHS